MAETVVTNILQQLSISTEKDINSGWFGVENASGDHGLFIIGIKGSPIDGSALPIEDLKYVLLELGIPSGIGPITLQMIKLDFDNITSFDNQDLNNRTAYVKIGAIPSKVCIRTVAYSDGSKEIRDGIMPVSINVLPF